MEKVQKDPTNPKTQDFRVSWLITRDSNKLQLVLKKDSSKQILTFKQESNTKTNVFGICQCPGKNFYSKRANLKFDRNITQDIQQLHQSKQLKRIICLLNEHELKTIGVDIKEYRQVCQKLNIELIEIPIIEMGVPYFTKNQQQNILQFDQMISMIADKIQTGETTICHCRGGIGRAGMTACCLILKLGLKSSYEDVVDYIRRTRDVRCVESQKQHQFIKDYIRFIADHFKII